MINFWHPTSKLFCGMSQSSCVKQIWRSPQERKLSLSKLYLDVRNCSSHYASSTIHTVIVYSLEIRKFAWSLKSYWEQRRDASLMLAPIHDYTWNKFNMQHITPNLKRWNYSDISNGGHKKIKGLTHMVEGGHTLRIAPHPHPLTERQTDRWTAPHCNMTCLKTGV